MYIQRLRQLALASALIVLPGSLPAEPLEESPAYVGSSVCKSCHEVEWSAWQNSHHALAWTVPTAETIMGDFDDTEFAHDDTLTRFRIEDGTYYATVTEKDGSTHDHPVHSVAGIAPLQQYLLETEPGRLQSFDVVWDAEKLRWYHLYPDQDLPPDDGLHWTGPYKNWNGRCAECHATGFQKNYDLNTRAYASTQAEIGVGCEACHGPGSAHLDWANDRPMMSTAIDLDPYGFTMTFGQSVAADMEQCAGCHARREAFGEGNPLPGTAFADAYNLAVLRPGLYHADGQILEEVYVYGSFLQSRMYAKGVGCSDCHDAHTATRLADGNALCTQCHSTTGNPRFPTLRLAAYDTPAHHFHTPGTEGAQCKSCHMIERLYMGIDGRRDHSFRVPRPDLATETGSPDACTDCHQDKSAEWSAARIAEWFPDSTHRGPHYSQVLARGRDRPDLNHDSLVALAMDPEAADIVRATAMYLLEGAGDPGIAEQVATLATDPSPLVRTHMARLQRLAAPPDRLRRLEPLLSDPLRSVRIAAARELLVFPRDDLPSPIARTLSAAQAEWQSALQSNLDMPETHLVMGGLALSLRNPPAAERAFREVVHLDPQRSEAWTMLVRIADVLRGRQAARQVLEEALEKLPADPSLQALASQL